MPGALFRTDDLPTTPLTRAALEAARPLLDRLLRLDRLEAGYEEAARQTGVTFPERALGVLDVSAHVAADALAAIPAQGPLIIAANHPHGALDGLLLAELLGRIRPDVKLLANCLLSHIPAMREHCFFVDPFGGTNAAARSRSGLRAAHLWLRQAGALVIFPAGEVASGPDLQGTRRDSPWADTVGRLAVATGASILPAFIEGANSPLFYAAGWLHPLLRTALLPRELLAQRGREVSISFGSLMTRHDVARAGTPSAATAAARRAVDALAVRTVPSVALTRAERVAREVEALPAGARLIAAGAFEVYAARAREIPHTLSEIGRLREITYRAVGEGTGRLLDLDEFDDRYDHLFAWDKDRRQLVGAYRIGDATAIVAKDGVNGLYTRTLFRYDARLLARIGPALELGRSWIRAEYQKNYNALLVLWKGIGRFVVERSNARVLFGPVSISARYCDSSHALLMAFLEQNHLDRELADLVEAVHPARSGAPVPGPATVPDSIDETHRRVAEMESDGKGVPVLLRQYLKLHARVLGFNVDPSFGDALDALMMVDLTTVDPGILTRYLGKEQTALFLARHGDAVSSPRAA